MDLEKHHPRVDEKYADARADEAKEAIASQERGDTERDPAVKAQERRATNECTEGNGFTHVMRCGVFIADAIVEEAQSLAPRRLGCASFGFDFVV